MYDTRVAITEREAQILEYISSASPISRIGVINHFDPQTRCRETHDVICHLKEMGFICNLSANSDMIKPTPSGNSALSAFRDIRNEHAKRDAEKEEDIARAAEEKRKDRKHDYLVAIFGFFLWVLSTLIAEHFNEIVAVIKYLVH